jgi:SAM-dependent methyltransferase
MAADRIMTHWPSFLRELKATESAWNDVPVRYPREDAVHWMPFQLGQFVTLLTEAVAVTPPPPPMLTATEEPGQPRFLDVGCGPGTKVRLAQAMFSLNAFGIDIVPRFISEAQAHGAWCMLKDAFEMPERGGRATVDPWGYDDFQIVYVNRPSANQDELEHLVMERMAPDSVLIGVNWRNDPGKDGWLLAYQEYGSPGTPVCGVWIKP